MDEKIMHRLQIKTFFDFGEWTYPQMNERDEK